MAAEKFKFEFCGDLDLKKESDIPINIDPETIKLYKDGYRSVIIDLPTIIGPLEPHRFCSSFFDLPQLIREDEAIERYRQGKMELGDDLLIFSRQLAGNREPDICQGIRKIEYKPWDYNIMGTYMQSRQSIPYYVCPECGNYDEAYFNENMLGHSISFIAESAARYWDKQFGGDWPNRIKILDPVFEG